MTVFSDDVSHGDFPSCLMLSRTLQLPTLGLYYCEDVALSALKQACQPWQGLFMSRGGDHFTLLRPTFAGEAYVL